MYQSCTLSVIKQINFSVLQSSSLSVSQPFSLITFKVLAFKLQQLQFLCSAATPHHRKPWSTLISLFRNVTTLQFISTSSPWDVDGISLPKHQIRVLVHRVGLLHKLYCSTAGEELIDETVTIRSFNTEEEPKIISSSERAYDFDYIETFKSCLANVSFLYTMQFNQWTLLHWEKQLID